MGNEVVLVIGLAESNRNAHCPLSDLEFLVRSCESDKSPVEVGQVVTEHVGRVPLWIDGDEDHQGLAGDVRVLVEHLGQLRQVNRTDVRARGVAEVDQRQPAFGLLGECEGVAVDVGQGEVRLRSGRLDGDSREVTGGPAKPRGPLAGTQREGDGQNRQYQPRRIPQAGCALDEPCGRFEACCHTGI